MEHIGSQFRNYEFRLQICMPSGACVRVEARSQWFNLYIDGLPEDKNNGVGLCGNFNGDPDDDMMTPNGTVISSCSYGCPEFSDHWRVDPQDDLFDVQITPIQANYPIPRMCKCDEHGSQNITCGPKKNQGMLCVCWTKQNKCIVPS